MTTVNINHNKCPNCHRPYWDDGHFTAPVDLCDCHTIESNAMPDYTGHFKLEFYPKPLKEVRFCKYCGGQRLTVTTDIVFGPTGPIKNYYCEDCQCDVQPGNG